MMRKIAVYGFLFAVIAMGALPARAAQSRFPAMAPLAAYLEPSAAAEIALARSGGPASISKGARVWVLGKHGYSVAVEGTNGWSCIVERSWSDDFTDPDFWNPRTRAPICFNPPASRTEVSEYIARTRWVFAHLTPSQMIQRAKASVAAKEILPPEPGAMCYMLSKNGYLGANAGGPWRPHIMIFAHVDPILWGAGAKDAPLIAFVDPIEPVTIFMVPVRNWSDGTTWTPH